LKVDEGKCELSGDSYSAVELTDGEDKPTAANPLGVEFPGHTWNEIDKPNWVGHLITKYTPGPRFKPGQPLSKQDPQWAKSPLLVHDFARGGDTVDGVRRQVERSFVPDLGKKPKRAPGTATDSLFGESSVSARNFLSPTMIFSNLGRNKRLRVGVLSQFGSVPVSPIELDELPSPKMGHTIPCSRFKSSFMRLVHEIFFFLMFPQYTVVLQES